jgi:hypothetical protein
MYPLSELEQYLDVNRRAIHLQLNRNGLKDNTALESQHPPFFGGIQLSAYEHSLDGTSLMKVQFFVKLNRAGIGGEHV